MTGAVARPARPWWYYLLFLLLGALVLSGAAAWYMTTDSFQAFVRSRDIVAQSLEGDYRPEHVSR